MKAQILNLYSNEKETDTRLKNDHGQSFLISIGDEQILFDFGQKSPILLHNMAELQISPDAVTKLVVSHGHLDHTGGLPGFLEKRTRLAMWRSTSVTRFRWVFDMDFSCDEFLRRPHAVFFTRIIKRRTRINKPIGTHRENGLANRAW